MSAPSSGDANKAALIRFDHYADLPAEIRIKVIHQFVADFRKRNPSKKYQKLAPFAALHSEWQHELEPDEKLWGRLILIADDLPTYRSGLNERRARSLFNVFLWIMIDDDVIDPDHQGYAALNGDAVRSRVEESVVHSVSTLFECVNYAKSTRPQRARKGIKLHADITIPEAICFGEHSHILSDIEFDFSRLPPTDAICEFSQGGTGNPDAEGLMLLNRSSLLSLFSRMPNLERADVHLDTTDTTPVDPITKFNYCPRLKKLTILAGQPEPGLPGTALSGWVSNWSHNIVSLRLGSITDIPDFLRRLATPSHGRGTIAWPNLELIQVCGWFHLSGAPGGDHLHGILSEVPSALISMPRLKTMAVFLICPEHMLAAMRATLFLQPGASRFVLSTRDPWPEERSRETVIDLLPLSLLREMKLWELVDEDRVRSAVAGIQAAVQTQRGEDLEVILPGKDHGLVPE